MEKLATLEHDNNNNCGQHNDSIIEVTKSKRINWNEADKYHIMKHIAYTFIYIYMLIIHDICHKFADNKVTQYI